jgi:ketosteroid isomerase-like protein
MAHRPTRHPACWSVPEKRSAYADIEHPVRHYLLALRRHTGSGDHAGWLRRCAAFIHGRPGRLAAALTAQADRWDKAIARKDRAAIEANMADDFRQIDGAGNVETRQSFVDGVMAPELEIAPYTVEDFDARIYGDVALLSGRTQMTGKYQGKTFNTHYRYIDVYVRRDDEWKIVSVQISKIPATAAGAPPARDAKHGQHNFDFELGAWKTHLRRRLHPLTGSDTWVEYDGTSLVRTIWNGRANLVELDVTGPTGHLEALSLRL